MEISDHRHIFGERIKLLRKESNLTLAELSFACGIFINRLRRLERAVCKIRAGDLYKFADVFGVPCDFLVGLTDERTPRTRIKNRL